MRLRGFTLIELMIVISIIALLAGAVYVSIGTTMFESNSKATNGVVGSLRIALEAYRGQFRGYPPDGLDYEVKDHKGRPIKNTACLIHFLTRPIVKVSRVGSESMIQVVGPFMKPPKGDYLSGSLDADDVNLVEILDSWGNPLNYDNTGEGFSDMSGVAVHSMPNIEDFNVDVDPRGGKALGAEAYNLWSWGQTTGASMTGDEVPDEATRQEDNLTNWGGQ